MSLVAYGSSDESEEECEGVEKVQNVCGKVLGLGLGLAVGLSQNRPRVPISKTGADLGLGVEASGEYVHRTEKPLQSLFQNLPKPKQNVIESTDQDELESHTDIPVLAFLPVPHSNTNLFPLGSDSNTDLNKKVGLGPVKITLPSLSQFNDVEEDEPFKKKLKPSKKGSGLFAILPAPKNIKHRETQQPLLPYVLTKKVSQTPPPPSIHLNKTGKQTCLEADYESEDEGKDFFSLTSVSKLSNEEIGLGLSTDLSLNARTTPSLTFECNDELISNNTSSKRQFPFQSETFTALANASQLPGSSRESPCNYQETGKFYNSVQQHTSQEPSISFPPENLQLDAEAMQRLCGRRSKKNQEPVEIIDVNGTEIMPDPREWLVKQLSAEQPKMRSHSHKRNDGPTTQQRRKHQITYLAFQAKENELELKNQWSQNRMSRKQTQSKYGF